jgi:transcriptional regulator with XRE-family HTH domain
VSPRQKRFAAVASDDADQKVLGQALKRARADRGLTQEALSAATGLHTTYISDIERGARNPSWKTVVRLADGLEMSVAALVAGFDELREGA